MAAVLMTKNRPAAAPISKDELVCQLELLQTRSRLMADQLNRRAHDLEAGVRRLTQLYKYSPIAFITFDEGARIVDVNPAAARLLNIVPAAVLGLSFNVLVADKIAGPFIHHFRRARRGTETPVTSELTLLAGNLHRLPAQIITSVVPLDNGRIYETAIIDLTAHRAASEAIRNSQEYAEKIVATIPFPVLVLDSRGHVAATNSAFLEVFQTTEKNVITWPLSELPGVQWHSSIEEPMISALKDGEIVDELVIAAELTSGSVIWLQFSARRLTGKNNAHGPQLLVAFEDITRRKRAEEERQVIFEELEASRSLLEQRVEERTEELAKSYGQLRKLGEQLVLAHESEQRRIARELHDQIGQDLTALKIMLTRASRGEVEDMTQAVLEATALTEETLATVRTICSTLRPQVLDDLGLIAGLEWHIKNFSTRTGVAVSFDHHDLDESRLNPIISSTIFRVIQEALTNISRHAETKRAGVILTMINGVVEFTIRDNGRGFDVADATQQPSTGLSGMRERILLVHGRFDVVSAPGEGTLINAHIPIPPARPNTNLKTPPTKEPHHG